jgi:hypothetical protein
LVWDVFSKNNARVRTLTYRSKSAAAAVLLCGVTAFAPLHAAVPVVWDGSAGPVVSVDPDFNGKWRWEQANWTKDGTPGQTAQATMGDKKDGLGRLDIVIGAGAQVYYDENRPCPRVPEAGPAWWALNPT